MTFTKRQKFLYRINSCINLQGRINGYIVDIIDYVKDSKFKYLGKKALKKGKFVESKLKSLLTQVD